MRTDPLQQAGRNRPNLPPYETKRREILRQQRQMTRAEHIGRIINAVLRAAFFIAVGWTAVSIALALR